MAFIDECKILFKAGDGGNGLVAWRREAHVPLGGPAGGDGGNGGSIILRGNHNENSLQTLNSQNILLPRMVRMVKSKPCMVEVQKM